MSRYQRGCPGRRGTDVARALQDDTSQRAFVQAQITKRATPRSRKQEANDDCGQTNTEPTELRGQRLQVDEKCNIVAHVWEYDGPYLVFVSLWGRRRLIRLRQRNLVRPERLLGGTAQR